MPLLTGLVLLTGIAAVGGHLQRPLSPVPFQEDGRYQFESSIQRVAVIGAGPTGLVAYRELAEAGLDVRIFERDSVPGGNWHYTDETPLDAPVPNAPAATGDFVPSFPPPGVDLPYSAELEDDGRIWKEHRAPKPLWESLTCTIPSPLQQFTQWPWPSGTPWELSHYQVRNYIRSYASYLNVNSNDENPKVAYNTRVEHVEKRLDEAGQERGWRLWLRSLEPTQSGAYQATWWTEDFDAVVVAVGKHNAPSMPSIPGLADWVQEFPDLVRHSRQYRRPQQYVNETVLVIGAATSGAEISRDLNHYARKIYQSYRPDKQNRTHYGLEHKLRRIPRNTTFIGEIHRFSPISKGSPIQTGFVELKNGTILSGIDSVILATGYRLSYPFLSHYYDGATYEPHPGSAVNVLPFLPLDGLYVRDLYLDQFYIRDPTIAFIGFVPSWPSIDYTSLALAKVWTNKAKLPNSREMWAWHEKTVQERGGYGKYFLFLAVERAAGKSDLCCIFPSVDLQHLGCELARVTFLIGWLNEAAVKYGGKQVDGIPKHHENVAHYWQIAHYGGPLQIQGQEQRAVLASLDLTPGDHGGQQVTYHDILFYDDEW